MFTTVTILWDKIKIDIHLLLEKLESLQQLLSTNYWMNF